MRTPRLDGIGRNPGEIWGFAMNLFQTLLSVIGVMTTFCCSGSLPVGRALKCAGSGEDHGTAAGGLRGTSLGLMGSQISP